MNIEKQSMLTNYFSLDCTSDEHYFIIDSSQNAKKRRFEYIHRRGTRVDVFNMWRKPEIIDDCSRADIKRAYRLGKWY